MSKRTHQAIYTEGGNEMDDNRAGQHVGISLHVWEGQEMNRKKIKGKKEKEQEKEEKGHKEKEESRYRCYIGDLALVPVLSCLTRTSQ